MRRLICIFAVRKINANLNGYRLSFLKYCYNKYTILIVLKLLNYRDMNPVITLGSPTQEFGEKEHFGPKQYTFHSYSIIENLKASSFILNDQWFE